MVDAFIYEMMMQIINKFTRLMTKLETPREWRKVTRVASGIENIMLRHSQCSCLFGGHIVVVDKTITDGLVSCLGQGGAAPNQETLATRDASRTNSSTTATIISIYGSS